MTDGIKNNNYWLNDYERVESLVIRQLQFKKNRDILRITRIVFSFLLMLLLGMTYEVKQSLRWVFFGVPLESSGSYSREVRHKHVLANVKVFQEINAPGTKILRNNQSRVCFMFLESPLQLTDNLKSLYIKTAHMLKGIERRQSMTEVVKNLGFGGQTIAEKKRGWNRRTIRNSPTHK